MNEQMKVLSSNYLPYLGKVYAVITATKNDKNGDMLAEGAVLYPQVQTFDIQLHFQEMGFDGNSLKNAPEALDLEFMLEQARTLAWASIYDHQSKIIQQSKSNQPIAECEFAECNPNTLLQLWTYGFKPQAFYELRDRTHCHALSELLGKYVRFRQYPR